MKLKELITSAGAKKISHTKVWSNVAYAVATVCFVRFNWIAQEPNLELWIAYLGFLSGAATASKFLALRYGQTVNNTEATS